MTPTGRVPLILTLCLILMPVASATGLRSEHDAIADLIVEEILDGRTDGVRVVATPAPFSSAHLDEFHWTMGPVEIPKGAAWFALADETPGVLGFHPVTHVYLDENLDIIEIRRERFYPRYYRDGTRLGFVTLVEYRAKPGKVPEDRKPVGGNREADDPGTDGSYNDFYAVIIEGDVPSGSTYSEFWSDNVRLFRILLEYGYQDDNIHVLYGEGSDETEFECEYYRENMVDYPAYQQDVRDLFTWMRDGNPAEGIDRVTDQDFIFLFTFDHGGSSGGCDATLCLMDGCMPDTEFASYFNQIDYKHRAVDMQQCHSGGFIDNLENDTTVISTAANCTESAYEADEWDDCGGGVSVNYGEWNYWWMSAMEGHKPWPGFEPVDADTDDDGMVSFEEAHNYALANDDRSEHPQWSDPGNLGNVLSLNTTWAGVHLRHNDHEIEDTDGGNGDGVVNPDESIVMPVTLENIGEEDGNAISGTLSTDSPWVTVTDDYATYPDMVAEGGAGRSNPDHYSYVVDAETPDDTDVAFHIDWTSNGGAYSGTVTVHEPVYRVDLSVQQTSVLDDEQGNGDGIADPGEAIRLAVTLRNRGHAAALEISGTLTTSSPWAVVTDSEAEFEDIAGLASGRSLDPHFGLEIDAGTPDRTWIDCDLLLRAADGYEETLPLRFMVGSRGTVLIVEDGDPATADLLEDMVGNLGFAPIRETAEETDPESWLGYSILLWSAGSNTDSVSDSAWRDSLESFVSDGGRLLMEGGELGYDHRYNTSFRNNVLHASGWSAHGGGDLTVLDETHPIATMPHILDPALPQDAPENGQRDAVTPSSDARAILDWETRPGKGSVVAFDDDDLEGNGGQIVSLFADCETILDDAGQRASLFDNSMEWLIGNDRPYLLIDGHRIDDVADGNGDLIVDPGETISLIVALANRGSSTASGIWARATSDQPGYVYFVDNYADWPSIASSGAAESLDPHLLLNIADDTPCGTKVTVSLEITTAEGFSGTRALEFTVGTGGGQHLTYEWAESEPIPNPGILDAPIEVGDPFRIGDVNCYVNADHSSISLIKVILEGPEGNRVTLHDQTGDGMHLVTTYDSETQPIGPGEMSDYDGQEGAGTWHLYVNDLRQDMMAGVLNRWRLIFDTIDLCHEFVCEEPVPDDVGNTLTMARLDGTDVRLEWSPAAGAAGYVIWRSPHADMTVPETAGRTEGTTFDEVGLPQSSRVYFYQVRAENGCHDEGP